MPSYDFKCLKCSHLYEELTDYDKTGKYEGVNCPNCGSEIKDKVFDVAPGIIFDKPKESSKWESESYRWGYNKEKAQKERINAMEKSHMGRNPYPNIS